MKILILIDVYSKSPMGGAGTVLLETAKAFRRSGHEVLVLCRRRRDLAEYEFVEGVPFWTCHAPHGGIGSIWRLTRAYSQMCQEAVAGHRWDAILNHHPLPLWIVGKQLPSPIPVVSVFHSPWPEEYRLLHGEKATFLGRKFRALVENEALERSDWIVALSRYMGEEAQKRYPHCRSRVEVVPGGVDTGRFSFCDDPQARRADLGIPFPASAFWVLTIRRHVPRMGIDGLLSAVARLRDEARDLRLIVGGTGPLERTYRKRVRDLSIEDRVFFTGFIHADKLADYYAAADLFVMPSRQLEGFGLAVLESMAAGTPVLATPVGGMPEILTAFDPELVVGAPDESALAHRLLSWYGRREDLRAMRPACRRFVEERYSWDAMATGIERVIESVRRARQAQ